MCGISGIVGQLESRNLIHKMTDVLKHRGHDFIGHYDDNLIALGHNRLSIIDLDASAHQPFHQKNSPFILIFNGEIYNYKELRLELEEIGYRFFTNSDTEVLYKAYTEWGKSCLSKLNGMFAFAVWDKVNEKLFAARDRFGVKPFYYHYDGKKLIFSSEIKAIKQAVELTLNQEVLANYFMYGSYGMPSQTFYNEINQLPAGHFLNFEKQKLDVKKWYDFVKRTKAKIKSNANLTQSEAVESYKTLLEKSINFRFRADVPAGFTISGGVDSSLLLALINQRKDAKTIKAFTFYTGHSDYDELPWVEQMVSKTQTQLKPVLFQAKDFKKWHKFISQIQDEPYGGIPTLAYAKLFNEIKNEGIKVVLDGQGMDEAWAGYDYYQSNSSQTIQGQKLNPFKFDVLSDELKSKSVKSNYPKPFNDDLLDKQYRDLFYTKIPRALRFNDRISMASTVELREPFLDYELVEFAFSLPEHFKIKNGQGKYLLRQILKDYSEEVAFAPKRPLQTPQREWLADDLKDEVEKAIQEINASSFKYMFDIKALDEEWKKYLNGCQDSSFHLWQWISFSKLIREI